MLAVRSEPARREAFGRAACALPEDTEAPRPAACQTKRIQRSCRSVVSIIGRLPACTHLEAGFSSAGMNDRAKHTHTRDISAVPLFYLSTPRCPAWLAKGVDASQQTNVFQTICMHHTHTRTFVRDCGMCADWSESRRDRERGGPGQETEEAEPNHRSPHCPPEHALAQCDPLSPRAVLNSPVNLMQFRF